MLTSKENPVHLMNFNDYPITLERGNKFGRGANSKIQHTSRCGPGTTKRPNALVTFLDDTSKELVAKYKTEVISLANPLPFEIKRRLKGEQTL